MAAPSVFEPRYQESWAIVIGINAYTSATPLGYARNDATDFAKVLLNRFAFVPERVAILLDGDATRQRIMQEYLSLVAKAQPNDRIVFFFAGHGLTIPGQRGDVGYLIPVDGTASDLSSLIRWDELTRNADLIPAKHMLFVMDACYSGLAITRRLSPGSSRFVRDMLQRLSRQVITAGKADEVVADAGGPRAGHSVFTGHLLDALEGAAATADGILTAAGVMAYVYDRVAKDEHSNQTPHYGTLHGDGDMILQLPQLDALNAAEGGSEDILITAPTVSVSAPEVSPDQKLADRLKTYLSEAKHRIALDDELNRELRRVVALLGPDQFPTDSDKPAPGTASDRIGRYEHAVQNVMTFAVLLGRWGGEQGRPLLRQVFARLGDANPSSAGYAAWSGLRSYPLSLPMYASGVAALSASDFHTLAALLSAPVRDHSYRDKQVPLATSVSEGLLETERAELFKLLPGYERYYAPRSEYMFKTVQPILEEHLYLGSSYERLFDTFEALYALVVADQKYDERGSVWGPPGRFAWRFQRGDRDGNPYLQMLEEADKQKKDWPPLNAGLFGGSYDRFKVISDQYTQLIQRLRWH